MRHSGPDQQLHWTRSDSDIQSTDSITFLYLASDLVEQRLDHSTYLIVYVFSIYTLEQITYATSPHQGVNSEYISKFHSYPSPGRLGW